MTGPPQGLAQTNGVLRELYTQIPGGAVADLTNAPRFPALPDDAFVEPVFEAPSNFTDNYGQRMRALLVPPTTGSYVFYIASDDNSALFLSTDESPAHKRLIASETSWTASRQYTLHASQKSAPVLLTNGSRYYIEALQKEGTGGDNLSVTWQKPGDAAPTDGAAPIPGANLVPFGLGPPQIVVQPTNVNVIEGGSATFAVQLSQRLSASFQWLKNGNPIPAATNVLFTLSQARLLDSGSKFSCYIANGYGSTNSAVATLTVNPDVTRPTIASAGNPGNPQVLMVIFSEPVETASACNPANYGIDNGVRVLSATFGPDSHTILLDTTPMATGTTYVLTVNNVRDRATTPNTIALNSQRSFSLESKPLPISLFQPPPEPLSASSRHGPIVISEIMYHPRTDGKNLEFIEIYNSNPFLENIGGYRITGDVEFTFPTNTSMPGRSFLLLVSSLADFQSVYPTLTPVGAYSNHLSNGSGKLQLRNREDGVVFQVTFSGQPPWPVAADGAGHSLVLAQPSLGERNPLAWSASVLTGGSPGTAEPSGSDQYKTVRINEVLAHTDPPDLDYIELFNYSSTAVDLSGCLLTDDPATNKFVIPAQTTIPAQGFVVFYETQLGFRLNAAGESILLRDPTGTQMIDALRFGAQENGVAYGRSPDGAAEFSRLITKTPGAPNSSRRIPAVVINEIMYAPISENDDDQYVELYNQSATDVDLSRWRLQDGISYTFPQGTVLRANSYLVVARNVPRILTRYPNLTGANTLGNFSGTLGHNGDRLALAFPDTIISTNSVGLRTTNTIHVVTDEVTYEAGGRWGKWSHAGGSSLELMDARSDGRFAPNWADSDETAKSAWMTVEQTGVLDNGNGDCDALHIILLGPGECLVDNVEVFASAGANLVENSDFDTGFAGWYFQGNHEDSTWEYGTGINGSPCLHVRSTDRGDTGANRIRTRLRTPLNANQTVTLRARVRWLAGNPEILLRLKGNWLEATASSLTAANLGTPGARNSRQRGNAPPAISGVRHSPVVPVANQTVTIIAKVDDVDGLAGLFLKYRLDPSTNFTSVPMQNNGAGLYSAAIPGQPSGTMAAFHIQALDNAKPRTLGQFPDDAPARECLLRWGDPSQPAAFGTYRIWMTQATLNRWSQREHLSNKPLDCTFVYGNSRVIYNIGGQYSGSPWHSPGFDSPTGNVCDYVFNFPPDDAFLGETDATYQWPGNGGGDNTYQREQTAYWLAEQAGLPYCYRRTINLVVNGVRRAEYFEDVQQPNGDMMEEYYPDGKNGDLHKVQIWYEFDDPAVVFSGRGASLQNFTTTGGKKKVPVYRWTFAKRAVNGSASNYTNLFALVDAANYGGVGPSYRRQLESKIDVDNWLKTYAVEHIVGNNDSFAYGGGQNMYTFKPTGSTWKMFIWDIDFAFVAQLPNSDVFQGIGRSCGIDLGEPFYRRRYWEILQDLALGPLSVARANPPLDARYNAMNANGRTVETPTSIKNFISQRRTYLLNLIATNAMAPFAITTTALSPDGNWLSVWGTAPIDVRSISVNGALVPLSWTSYTNWNTRILLKPGTNNLVLEGRNNANTVLPSAVTNLSLAYAGIADAPEQKLVINEIMYNPATPGASFVEILNTSTHTGFDLSGWRVAGVDFRFPDGSRIFPGEFVVIAADRNAFAAAYGINIPVLGEFNGRLQNGSETVRLVRPGSSPGEELQVDEVHYEGQLPWPTAANGLGASLQLIDPSQDNNRVANWAAVPPRPSVSGPQWRYVTATGTASSSTLYMYLQAAGEVYVDDLKLVAGSMPEQGTNFIANGDFESAFPGTWGVSANLSGSGLSGSLRHSGNWSLHMVASSGGATRSSAIYQDLLPSLAQGAPYTLSFWYLENTNGGTLTVRLSGNGIVTNVSLAPSSTPVTPQFTPGNPNSVAAKLPPFAPLWLNEIAPQNPAGPVDHLGHRHPWAELYNSSGTNLSLRGFFLANNFTNLTQWPLPATNTLAAGQFCVLWLDGNPAESTPNELHAGLQVNPSSGPLLLVSTNGGQTNIVDCLTWDGLSPARSYGAFPDGTPAHRRMFFTPTPGTNNDSATPKYHLLINEWMADNQTTLADPADNDFEDWFEIYNAGDSSADLTGLYLANSATNRTQFLIPAGYTMPARGYLLVWADGEPSQNGTNRADLHVNFKLSKTGESIGIFTPEGTAIDFVSFGAQATDLSQGRFPDGSSDIYSLTTPSPGRPNIFEQPNTAPWIDNISDQVVFEGQLLLLQIEAHDTNSPAQHLSFALESGSPECATINADTGLVTFRSAPGQGAATNYVTVSVTDDGVPPLRSLASFMIRVVPLPHFTNLSRAGTEYLLTFSTIRGKTYRVEFKNALDDSEWLALNPETTATGDTLTVSDPQSAPTQRFYRIVVLP